jgi:hypothetical protein
MSQKQLLIFVPILFSIVGILAFMSYNRSSNVYKEILKADISQIKNVKFYKDYLRDDEGLDLPINKKTDLEAFLVALKTMKSTSRALKSVKTEKLYKVQLNLVVEDDRLLTINIHRTEETGDLGIISIDQEGTSGGSYESSELLNWVEKMKQKPEFEKIGITY